MPVVLFLGNRSPYGLSIARALLASRFTLRGVVVPSEAAYQRVAQRARRRGDVPLRSPGTGWRRLRRTLGAARRTAVDALRVGPAPAGGPAPRLLLDSGMTAEGFEEATRCAGAAWLQLDSARSAEIRERVRGLAPALILSAAFPMILDDELLSLARCGAINFHPSLLPRCRGSHPIFWTLATDEPRGGVTAHYMTREVDAGNIVAQIPLPLSEDEDYGSLYNRAMERSGDIVKMVQEFVLSNGGGGAPQDQRLATVFREDTDEDHRIIWHARSARQISALIRTGVAYTLWRRERLGVLSAAMADPSVEGARGPRRPGQVLRVGGKEVLVEAATEAVALTTLLWRGRTYEAGELARFLGLRAGKMLAGARADAEAGPRPLPAGVDP